VAYVYSEGDMLVLLLNKERQVTMIFVINSIIYIKSVQLIFPWASDKRVTRTKYARNRHI